MLPKPSRFSVSISPESRLRYRCSSRYLRISPLHLEFRFPLLYSRPTVSSAGWQLSHQFSHPTCRSAYAPFTPSESEQRLSPPYYRGCWHGVSRDFLCGYRQVQGSDSPHVSSPLTGFYTPRSFITHAALLRQTFVHCAIFPTAASRRSLGRISVPVWPITLSGRLSIVALVGFYSTNKLMERGLILARQVAPPFTSGRCRPVVTSGITPPFGGLSRTPG